MTLENTAKPIVKDYSVEVLRAFAVILVIIVHIASKFTIMSYSTVTAIYAFIDGLANAAVPLFVFISGYVLGKRYFETLPPVSYFKKRILRIIPPYVVATAFYLIFYAFLNKDYSSLNLSKFISSLTHADAAYHLWFIRLVVILYLIFPLLRVLLKSKVSNYFLFLSFALQMFWVYKGASLTNQQIAFSHIFYFCLGIYLSNQQLLIFNKKPGPVVMVILIVLLNSLLTYFWIKGTLIYGFFYSIPERYGLKALYTSQLLYSQVLITFFYFKDTIFNKLTSFLKKYLISIGKYAFEIYLIHLFFLTLVVKYLYQDNNFTNPSFFIVSVFLTLLLSYASISSFYYLKNILHNKT